MKRYSFCALVALVSMGLPTVTAGMLRQVLPKAQRSFCVTTKYRATDFSKNLKDIQKMQESLGLGRSAAEARGRQDMERFQTMMQQKAAFRRLKHTEGDIRSLYGSLGSLRKSQSALSSELNAHQQKLQNMNKDLDALAIELTKINSSLNWTIGGCVVFTAGYVLKKCYDVTRDNRR